MKSLKILSMNLGKKFVTIRDSKKKEMIIDFLNGENYDIVMLQGNSLINKIDFNSLDYDFIIYKDRMAILYARSLIGFDSDVKFGVASSTLIYDKGPIACINVNCYNNKNIGDIFEICDIYSNNDSKYNVMTRIITGRFPKSFDTKLFCDMFNLDDISTLVGQSTHIKNNREMLNHFFVSKNLECVNIHKLVGLTEVSKLGEAYPMEVTLKKVLK